MSSKWELSEVGNEGQLVGKPNDKDVVVPTDRLITDVPCCSMRS